MVLELPERVLPRIQPSNAVQNSLQYNLWGRTEALGQNLLNDVQNQIAERSSTSTRALLGLNVPYGIPAGGAKRGPSP